MKIAKSNFYNHAISAIAIIFVVILIISDRGVHIVTPKLSELQSFEGIVERSWLNRKPNTYYVSIKENEQSVTFYFVCNSDCSFRHGIADGQKVKVGYYRLNFFTPSEGWYLYKGNQKIVDYDQLVKN